MDQRPTPIRAVIVYPVPGGTFYVMWGWAGPWEWELFSQAIYETAGGPYLIFFYHGCNCPGSRLAVTDWVHGLGTEVRPPAYIRSN